MTDLGPFHNRPAEWELYQPLVGQSMLELGNKINRERSYKHFFSYRGFRHVSVDWNGLNGALKLDLQFPLNLGTFDMVTNIGTTEHVQDQAGVWRNICEAMHVGSVLLSATPEPGQWSGHGLHYPTDEFYRQLCALNGLTLHRLYSAHEPPQRMWFARMVRSEDKPFTMPDESLIRPC